MRPTYITVYVVPAYSHLVLMIGLTQGLCMVVALPGWPAVRIPFLAAIKPRPR
jgi:hypothetical protein